MYKRVLSLLLCVALMPALILGVNANATDVLDMNAVTATEFLPAGFVLPSFSSLQGSRGEVTFYDSYRGVYLNFSFLGRCVLTNQSGVNSLYFENFDSVSTRLYLCNGRTVHSSVPGQSVSITVPAQEINSYLKADEYFSGTATSGVYWPPEWVIIYDRGEPSRLRTSGTLVSNNNADIKFNNLSAKTQGNIKTVLNGFTMRLNFKSYVISDIDYYLVQKHDSSVSTDVDYPDTIKQSMTPSGYSAVSLGGKQVLGYPVAFSGDFYQSNYDSSLIRYSPSRAFYYCISYDGYCLLYGSDTLLVNPRPRLDVFNRFLSHFGYPLLDYSSDGSVADDGLDDIGGGLGSAFDDMAGFEDSANKTINDVTGSITQVGAISNKIWGIMPVWFWGITSVYLIFLVGRKIIGR